MLGEFAIGGPSSVEGIGEQDHAPRIPDWQYPCVRDDKHVVAWVWATFRALACWAIDDARRPALLVDGSPFVVAAVRGTLLADQRGFTVIEARLAQAAVGE